MLKPLSKGPFVCVNCGHQFNQSLVKVYGPEREKYDDGGNLINENGNSDDNSSKQSINPLNVKLTECNKCGQSVDYYLQMDDCLLILDAMLLKASFFRHIVHNCLLPKPLPIKLLIVYSFCETYNNWSKLSSNQYNYIELESMFYTLFLKFFFFNCIFFVAICFVFTLTCPTIDKQRFIISLVISSFAKIYKLFVTLWPSESQTIVDLLLEINLFASLVQCCTVASHHQIGKLNASLRLLFVYSITLVVNIV